MAVAYFSKNIEHLSGQFLKATLQFVIPTRDQIYSNSDFGLTSLALTIRRKQNDLLCKIAHHQTEVEIADLVEIKASSIRVVAVKHDTDTARPNCCRFFLTLVI